MKYTRNLHPIAFQIRFHRLRLLERIEHFHHVHYSEPDELRDDTRVYSDNCTSWNSAYHNNFLCLLQMRIF